MIVPNSPKSGVLPPTPTDALERCLNAKIFQVQWLAGDGSDRCYYRIHLQDSTLVMMQLSSEDQKKLEKNSYDWVSIEKIIREDMNLFTPKIRGIIKDHGAIVIEDYGDTMLETYCFSGVHTPADINQKYLQAFEIISCFLTHGLDKTEPWCQRAFDTDRMLWELNFFKQQFLEGVVGLEFNEIETFEWEDEALRLSQYLGEKALHFVHRDFHSRNLMIKGNDLAILDFQDARLGHPTYDLVSLIFDPYVEINTFQRLELLQQSFDFLKPKLSVVAYSNITTDWQVVLLHRLFKAIGSFAYLTTVKNKGDYLQYIKPSAEILDSVIEPSDNYPFLTKTLIKKILDWSQIYG